MDVRLTDASEADGLDVIPLHEVCERLNCSARSLMRMLAENGVPLVKLSRVNRGLRPADMRKLIDGSLQQVA